MAYVSYGTSVRKAIETIDHPYLRAAVRGKKVYIDKFKDRFGRFLEAAERRGIITNREKNILDRRYGVSGKPETLTEIGSDDGITYKRIGLIGEEAYRKLMNDRRSQEILDGLHTGSYNWPRPVGEWDPLDLVPSLARDYNLFRFLRRLEAEKVSDLTRYTGGHLMGYGGPASLRKLKKKLARRNLRLSALDIYIMSDDAAVDFATGPGLVRGFLQKPVGRREIRSLLFNYPRRSRVMVVDDDEGIRDAMGGTISSLGRKPVLCPGGGKALDAYKDDICLVLSDLNMPGMNGLELARKLKEKERGKV